MEERRVDGVVIKNDQKLSLPGFTTVDFEY